MTTLQPGTYILTRDVQNPSPDRRQRHDWRARETWKEGTVFSVVLVGGNIRCDDIDVLALSLQSSGASLPVYENDQKFTALMSSGAMKKIEEKPSDWLKRESVNAGLEAIAILDALAEFEVITLADVQQMAKICDAADDVRKRLGEQATARFKLKTLARIACGLEKYVLSHDELVEAQFGTEPPTSTDSPVSRAARSIVDSRIGSHEAPESGKNEGSH